MERAVDRRGLAGVQGPSLPMVTTPSSKVKAGTERVLKESAAHRTGGGGLFRTGFISHDVQKLMTYRLHPPPQTSIKTMHIIAWESFGRSFPGWSALSWAQERLLGGACGRGGGGWWGGYVWGGEGLIKKQTNANQR